MSPAACNSWRGLHDDLLPDYTKHTFPVSIWNLSGGTGERLHFRLSLTLQPVHNNSRHLEFSLALRMGVEECIYCWLRCLVVICNKGKVVRSLGNRLSERAKQINLTGWIYFRCFIFCVLCQCLGNGSYVRWWEMLQGDMSYRDIACYKRGTTWATNDLQIRSMLRARATWATPM